MTPPFHPPCTPRLSSFGLFASQGLLSNPDMLRNIMFSNPQMQQVSGPIDHETVDTPCCVCFSSFFFHNKAVVSRGKSLGAVGRLTLALPKVKLVLLACLLALYIRVPVLKKKTVMIKLDCLRPVVDGICDHHPPALHTPPRFPFCSFIFLLFVFCFFPLSCYSRLSVFIVLPRFFFFSGFCR